MAAARTTKRKVFGIGLSRTGTTTLAQALRMLGFVTEHFPHDPLTRHELLRFWADPTHPFALTAAAEYDALTDTPVATVYRELSRAYPDSRFVLTLRDEAAWLASCARVWPTAVARQYDGEAGLAAYCRAVNRQCYGTDQFEPAAFRDAHRRHVREVRAWFACAPARLLELDPCAGQGWERLCPFLGVTVPARPFPRLNPSG